MRSAGAASYAGSLCKWRVSPSSSKYSRLYHLQNVSHAAHIRLAAYFPVPFNNNTPLAPCCLFPVVLLRPCPEPWSLQSIKGYISRSTSPPFSSVVPIFFYLFTSPIFNFLFFPFLILERRSRDIIADWAHQTKAMSTKQKTRTCRLINVCQTKRVPHGSIQYT